jgi:6-pyruvoyltetrahydropterin/6-carboxytetrahydropterin synthase
MCLISMRIEIDGEYSGIKFSASHIIPGHAKCGRLHGHGYILHLVLYGEKAADGMVMDFVELKMALRNVVEELDHRVLLPARSKDVHITRGREVEVLIGPKRYVFPNEDVAILDISQTSAEELAEHVLARLIKVLDPPSNVTIIEVGLDEERGQTAWAKREVGD